MIHGVIKGIRIKIAPKGFILKNEYVGIVEKMPMEAIVAYFSPLTNSHIPVILIGDIVGGEFMATGIEMIEQMIPDDVFKGIAQKLDLDYYLLMEEDRSC